MSSLSYPAYVATGLPDRLRRSIDDRLRTARALKAELRADLRRNDVIHIIFIIAIVVLLVLAASLVAAAIILCAQHGGVLEFVTKLDPWTVKVGCKKI